MTRHRRRISQIIRELSRMSRNWADYTAADWAPLEAELQRLTQARKA